MKKLKLSAKIIGGFGIVILLMIGVIGVYQFTTVVTTREFEGLLNNDVAQEIRAHQALTAMLRGAMAKDEFLLKKDEKLVASLNESFDTAVKHLTFIKEAVEAEGALEQAKKVAAALVLVGEYRLKAEEVFKAMKTIGLNEQEGLQKVFRDAAHALQSNMTEHDLSRLGIAQLQMRRYEKDYLLNPEANLDKFKAAISDYEAILASPEVTPPADVKKGLVDGLATYQAAVAKLLADPETDREANVTTMENAGQEMEAALTSVNVPGVVAMALEIRRQEKDYLMRQDDKYAEQNKAAVARLRDTLAKSGITKEHLDDVAVVLDTYDKVFSAMVAENRVIAKAETELAEVEHKLTQALAKLAHTAEQDGEVLTKQITAHAHQLAGVAIAASIATIVLALGLAFALARSICRPIDMAVKSLISGAEQLAAASGQVSSSSQVLAEGATEQAASLEETSASMEEMASMTRQNSDNASQADVLMRESLSTIKEADDSMVEMGRSMNEIADASAQTSKIIKTIDEIAFQTNLLALNAAVEAARAGEAGAGFAVVADEVRNLAMRATEAAKNTAALIEGTVSKVSLGKGIVERATEAFNGVAVSSAKVASLIGEIASASREQAQGFGQINQAITQMDTVTQQNSATAEESAAAAAELNSQSASMMDIVQSLKSLVDGGATKASAPPPPASAKALVASSPRPAALTSRGKAPAKELPAPTVKPAPNSAANPAAKPAQAPPPRKVTAKVNPKDVIPMDDDDTFEDF